MEYPYQQDYTATISSRFSVLVPAIWCLTMVIIQGVPQYCFHFVFCHFLGFWSTYRGTSDLYSTALEICYIIATKILKIVLEIAEIIEVKVGTRNTKITFLTLRNSKMSISK